MAVREDAYEFIERIPGSEFMTEEEKLEAADLLQPGLDAMGPGRRPQNNDDIREFLEYMGFSFNSPLFWEAFREWYGG